MTTMLNDLEAAVVADVTTIRQQLRESVQIQYEELLIRVLDGESPDAIDVLLFLDEMGVDERQFRADLELGKSRRQWREEAATLPDAKAAHAEALKQKHAVTQRHFNERIGQQRRHAEENKAAFGSLGEAEAMRRNAERAAKQLAETDHAFRTL